ncbi:MAG TPA: PAS domain S-box protein [Devosia sp.]|nr:PAS domain S-box protein [Devosia sp.]
MVDLSSDGNTADAEPVQIVKKTVRGSTAGSSHITVEALLEALPEAVYVTDANGLITFYNEAAAALWGTRPEIGKNAFCGSWKLHFPDGTPMMHEECPMAVALRERRPVRDVEAIAERPDGTLIPFLAFPTPILGPDGILLGAVNMLVDITDRQSTDEIAQRYAAIVEFSDDAILAKDLDGTIITWNRGAERLFGYTAAEAIGRSVAMLVPADRHDEEPNILSRIRRGERIDHYETIRRRKDGSLVEISLTVSPIRNRAGRVIGASKIAHDITDRRRAEEQQHLLLREMDHRVKNLFTLASSLVTLSARSALTTEEMAQAVTARLNALAQAHSLTIRRTIGQAGTNDQVTTLHALIQIIAAPYSGSGSESSRLTITGPDITVAGSAVTSFALLLHEFATNAAKYGGLSVSEGGVNIVCEDGEVDFGITWTEHGGPALEGPGNTAGFGSLLAKATVGGQLGGEIMRTWRPEGLRIRLTVAKARLGANDQATPAPPVTP